MAPLMSFAAASLVALRVSPLSAGRIEYAGPIPAAAFYLGVTTG